MMRCLKRARPRMMPMMRWQLATGATISIRAKDVAINQLIPDIASKGHLNIVSAGQLPAAKVSVDVHDVPAAAVLRAVAVAGQVQVIPIGQIFVVKSPQKGPAPRS